MTIAIAARERFKQTHCIPLRQRLQQLTICICFASLCSSSRNNTCKSLVRTSFEVQSRRSAHCPARCSAHPELGASATSRSVSHHALFVLRVLVLLQLQERKLRATRRPIEVIQTDFGMTSKHKQEAEDLLRDSLESQETELSVFGVVSEERAGLVKATESTIRELSDRLAALQDEMNLANEEAADALEVAVSAKHSRLIRTRILRVNNQPASLTWRLCGCCLLCVRSLLMDPILRFPRSPCLAVLRRMPALPHATPERKPAISSAPRAHEHRASHCTAHRMPTHYALCLLS